VKYYDSFIDDGTLNIVMEYCDKGDLDAFIKIQNGMAVSEMRLWKFLIEIALGFESFHALNVLHRDLKPKNIFLTREYEVWIGDFGVIKDHNFRYPQFELITALLISILLVLHVIVPQKFGKEWDTQKKVIFGDLVVSSMK
jgi:serine/threonine protein kinase